MHLLFLLLGIGFLGLALLVGRERHLEHMEDALDGIGHAIDGILYVLLAKHETDLLEELLIKRVPVVSLLGH